MLTYKDSGVDIDAGNLLVQKLKEKCPEIGGFSGLYPLGDQYLAATTDGVGTKLKLAFELGIHHTVGIDLVAMCVNDLLACGAKPLFFLDYYATGKLEVDQAEGVLSGILEGCHLAQCPLLGGETAEMPGMYAEGEYDLAGFSVGIVDKDKVIDGSTIERGDWVIGLPSSGLHSNGFSLVRKILDHANEKPTQELLTPTKIYVEEVLALCRSHEVRGIAHITGGGLQENIERILPTGLSLTTHSWEIPQIFTHLQSLGNVAPEEMQRTFNMGIGMALILSESEAKQALSAHPHLLHIGQISG